MVDEKRLEEYITKEIMLKPNITVIDFHKSNFQFEDSDTFNYYVNIVDKNNINGFSYEKCGISFTIDNNGKLTHFCVCLSDYKKKKEDYCKATINNWDSLSEEEKAKSIDSVTIFNNKSKISMEYFNFPTDFSNYIHSDETEIENCLINCTEEMQFTEDDMKNAFENNKLLVMYKKYSDIEISCYKFTNPTLYNFKIQFTRCNCRFTYEKSFATRYKEKIIMNLLDIYYDLTEQNWKEEAGYISYMLQCFGEEVE